jgi:hypothetical protein
VKPGVSESSTEDALHLQKALSEPIRVGIDDPFYTSRQYDASAPQTSDTALHPTKPEYNTALSATNLHHATERTATFWSGDFDNTLLQQDIGSRFQVDEPVTWDWDGVFR